MGVALQITISGVAMPRTNRGPNDAYPPEPVEEEAQETEAPEEKKGATSATPAIPAEPADNPKEDS